MGRTQGRPARRDPIDVGQRVFHEKFGYGVVTVERGRKARYRIREGGPEARHGSLRGEGMKRRATPLETVFVTVPQAAVAMFENAMQQACSTIGSFIADEEAGTWRVEGVKAVGENEDALTACIALAQSMTGISATLERCSTEAEGWLARVYSGFPEQPIGRRFAIRGEHVAAPELPGRVTLTVDAGLAFGSGEHGSTRGCLRALERIAYRRPQRILDLAAARDSCHGCCGTAPQARARGRYRSLVGPCGG